MNIEIAFCYESFKWKNNASHNAGVTVTIIGLQKQDNNNKYIYSETQKRVVKTIGPYLIPGVNSVVDTCSSPLSPVPNMTVGIYFKDNGNLFLSSNEKNSILKEAPTCKDVIKKIVGAEEYLKGKEKWCLWITDDTLSVAEQSSIIKKRLEAVRQCRLESSAKETREYANKPYRPVSDSFVPGVPSIIIPTVSSERRDYIPIGYLPADTVIVAPNFAIYDAPLWLFAILTSRMHMTWMRAVCGKLETRYRYSNTLVYNTFPFPKLTKAQKKALESTATSIIDTREEHYDMTMAQLYDPDKMPDDLKAAHEANDLLVDRLFRKTGFDSDEDRLAELFRLYEANTKGDN